MLCRLAFGGQNMDAGFWKVLDTTGMVEVEVSENDVPDISSRVAEPLDLAQCGILLAQMGVEDEHWPGEG